MDDTSFVSDGQQRDSVRVSSVDNFGLGTLWVMDAYHVPYGCRYVAGCHDNSSSRNNISFSVWGAYWSVGVDLGWPNGNIIFRSIRSILTSAPGGEIDIFEGVNLQNSNQMTLHTGSGCTMPHGISQTGTALGTDCGSSPSNNAGCGVVDANAKSYGKPFADSGGGVWVTQFDTSGIRIWFVPVSDHTSGAISHG